MFSANYVTYLWASKRVGASWRPYGLEINPNYKYSNLLFSLCVWLVIGVAIDTTNKWKTPQIYHTLPHMYHIFTIKYPILPHFDVECDKNYHKLEVKYTICFYYKRYHKILPQNFFLVFLSYIYRNVRVHMHVLSSCTRTYLINLCRHMYHEFVTC